MVSRAIPVIPPLTGTTAAAARYALYFSGAAAVIAVKFTGPLIDARLSRGATAAALKTLTVKTVAAAALCEVPALAGFLLFFLTGGYWDFYLLAFCSLSMELFHFPRRGVWEEAARRAL
jgi:hypothetical protein